MILRFPSTLRADASSSKPKWQKILPLGTWHNGGWPKDGVTFTAAMCATMVANWKKRGGPALPVDYLHRGADDSLPIEDQAASGWIETLEARDDGLWAQIAWTAKARALIVADEFRFISPELRLNGIDAATGQPQGATLIGAALVNRPALQELPRVAAASVQPAVPEQTQMNPILVAALAALGLKETATEADVTAKRAELEGLKASAETSLKAAAAEGAKVTALASTVENLMATVKELETGKKAAAIDALVKELQNDGKGNVRILAAQVDSVKLFANAVGIEAARTHFMAGPVVLKLGEKGIAGSDTAETAATATLKLQEIAVAAVKAGDAKPGEGMIFALTKHPELAEAATRKPIVVASTVS